MRGAHVNNPRANFRSKVTGLVPHIQHVNLERVCQPEQREAGHLSAPRAYRTQTVCKVVLHKSIPTQIRQLFLYIRNSTPFGPTCGA